MARRPELAQHRATGSVDCRKRIPFGTVDRSQSSLLHVVPLDSFPERKDSNGLIFMVTGARLALIGRPPQG